MSESDEILQYDRSYLGNNGTKGRRDEYEKDLICIIYFIHGWFYLV